MEDLSRRELVKRAALAGIAVPLVASMQALAQEVDGGPVGPIVAAPDASLDTATLHWLEAAIPTAGHATTLGVPWPRGAVKAEQTFKVLTDAGAEVPAQTWPMAYWPDGSLKWTAHAFVPGDKPAAGYKIEQGTPAKPQTAITVTESDDAIDIDTGVITCRINRKGEMLIERVRRGDQDILTAGRLVVLNQDRPSDDEGTIKRESFKSNITSVKVEQAGPVRAVVKIDGEHVLDSGRKLFPFSVRLSLHAGSDAIKIMHSFIFDADEQKDFISGIGVRFSVPMRGEMHNRHVRLVGENHGLFGEAIRGITGLRRDPGAEPKRAQVEGLATSSSTWAPAVADRLQYIPAWGDFSLSQLSADGFQIKKRTKAGHGWIPCGNGKRAGGSGFIGSSQGGVAFGIRDFWQKHPAQIDIRNAHTDVSDVTLWLWSPEASAMDLRFFHDGMGMDTYPKQIEGLNITYEDFEFGYGTPYGISRTSEIHLRALAATPSRQAIVEFADLVRTPPQLACAPKRYLDCQVFGGIWTLPDKSHPTKANLEEWMGSQLSQYIKEVDQQSWYGFWDYGDVMHSYDTDRNVWRYDVGGYAWDNCELSTDLWLWYSYLRTGRADVFRFAEAMSRHTGEVDVYHLGRFRGLGTRHGVQHWADSSKQSRISTPAYRRIHYFLTADERVGDLLREQLHTIEAEKKIVVGRKLGQNAQVIPLPTLEDPTPGGEVALGGLNFCNAMAAWMTEAERTGDQKLHAFIIKAIQGIGELPYGFYTTNWKMNIDTGEIKYYGSDRLDEGHLTAAFGLPEICPELILTYGEHAPKFTWWFATYGAVFTSSDDQKRKELGVTFKPSQTLADSYSRLTAYAAKYRGDKELAKRAWQQFFGNRGPDRIRALVTKRLEGPAVLNTIDAIPMGTNGAAQNGLAAMQLLAYVGDSIP